MSRARDVADIVGVAVPDTVLDAKGDLIAASAADTPARLGVGANNAVLTADSSTATGLAWKVPTSTAVGCMAFINGTSTAITSNVAKILEYANEAFDTHNFHSTSTNTSRFTIPAGLGGKYLVMHYVRLTWGVGNQVIYATKNGGTSISLGQGELTGDRDVASNTTSMFGATVTEFVAGDYVEFSVWTNTGSTGGIEARSGLIYLGA